MPAIPDYRANRRAPATQAMTATVTPFVAGETLTSNCSRVGAACGFDSARKFAALHGFDFKALASGDPAHVERFANLLDRPVAHLAAGAVRAVTPGISLVRGEALNRSLMMRKRPRFCPICLSDDERQVRARRGFRKFGRLNREVLPIRACAIHEVELMQVDTDVPPAFAHDFAYTMRSLKLRSYRLRVRAMEVDSLQSYDCPIVGHPTRKRTSKYLTTRSEILALLRSPTWDGYDANPAAFRTGIAREHYYRAQASRARAGSFRTRISSRVPVMPAASQNAYPLALNAYGEAVTIELDFVEPARIGGRF